MQDHDISSGDPMSSRPAGSARRVVERLDEAECLRLLGIRGLGRLVYNSRYGPMALPVEYTMHEGSIVFRTTRDTFTEEDLRTGIAHAEFHVALEVDQIDLAAREGWTVLVRGAAHHLDTEAERALIISAGVEPWIEGEPEHAIRIDPTRIWGHRIRLPAGSNPAAAGLEPGRELRLAGNRCWPALTASGGGGEVQRLQRCLAGEHGLGSASRQ